jgi:hypothetical protein
MMMNHGRDPICPPRADGLKQYDGGELIKNPYSVQGMVVREVGMTDRSNGEYLGYDDRVMECYGLDAYRAICKKFWNSGEMGIQDWARRATDQDIIRFGQAVVDLGTESKQLVGFRIVRDTNVASGFPCYLFQGVFKAD